MKNKRITHLTGFLIICFVFLAINILPCNAEEATTITFWHAMEGKRAEILKELVTKFNNSQPEIVVKETFIGSSDQKLGNNYHALYSEILKNLAQNNPPDMAQVYENWTTQLIESNSIVPLENFIEKPDGLTKNDLKDIYSIFLKANTFNNKLWTLPFNKSLYVLFYNKDEFNNKKISVPDNWNQFKEICEKLTQKENGQTSKFALAVKPNVDIFGLYLYSYDGEFIKNNTAVFNDASGIKSLQYWIDLVKEGFVSLNFTPMDDFISQKAFMYIGTTSKFADFKESAKFNFKIALLPEGTARRYQSAGTNLAIFSKSPKKKQEAAWKFISWLLRADNAGYFALKTGYLPVRHSSLATKEFQEFLEANPDYYEAIKSLEYAEVQPKVSAWETIRGFIDDAVYEVLSGKDTPTSALNKAASMANKILK